MVVDTEKQTEREKIMPRKKSEKNESVDVEKVEKKAEPPKPEVKHDVPLPIDSAASSVPELAGIDLSGNVGDEYAHHGSVNGAKVNDKDRPVLTLDDPALEEEFLEFAATKELFDIFEAKKKSSSSQLYDKLWTMFKDKVWSSRVCPKNPTIEVVINDVQEAKGIFQVKGGSSFKVNMSAITEGKTPREIFVKDLLNAGFSQEAMAVDIFEKEIDTTPVWTLNLTELMNGRIIDQKFTPSESHEQDAAKKLFVALQGEQRGRKFDLATRRALLGSIEEVGLDDLKKNLLNNVVYKTRLKSPDGFLDRVCGYCANREDLDAILTVITPVYFCSHVKFAPTADPAVKSQRLVHESDQIVRSELGLSKAS